MTEVPRSLVAALADQYAIERELGRGGAATVYLAQELKHGRRVALKVLRPEVAAALGADRFLREIRTVAALQHPHIVPLHDSGEAHGVLYYVMPYVEGESLRALLDREPQLGLDQVVLIAREVADGLAYAHRHGLVHRDIKPENILIARGAGDATGHALITDFGIARALSEAGGVSLTETGLAIGTPAYMSPEQATGERTIDGRSDTYSLGCVVYEMLVGHAPFLGRTAQELIARHLVDPVPPLRTGRRELSEGVERAVFKAMAKAPADRFATTSGFVAALTDGPTSPPRMSRAWLLGLLGLASLVAVGAFLVLRASRPSVNAHSASVSGDRTRSADAPVSFAVVPFRNVARDTALEYLAGGISDELLNAISQTAGVRITGRAAAERYANTGALDVRVVQRSLGARFLVTGTLRARDGQLVVSAQLNDSLSDGELWSETFTRRSNEFGALRDDISRAIVSALRTRVGGATEAPSTGDATGGTTNAEALDLYLVGQELLKHRGAGVARSIATFEKAIALDGRFARAYAALATALEYIPYFAGIPVEEVRDRTANAARRALELDSTLADAHVALGLMHVHAGEWAASDADFQRAVALEPGNATAHFAYARGLVFQGKLDRALAEIAEARKYERVSPIFSAWSAYLLMLAGRTDSALIESAIAIQLDSTTLPVRNLVSLVHLARGDKEVARRLVATPAPVGVMTNDPYVRAKLGDTAVALREVRAMEVNSPRPWFASVERASVYLAIGDTARALDALEASARALGPMWMIPINILDPAFDGVRHSARFIALLRKSGLDPALFSNLRRGGH